MLRELIFVSIVFWNLSALATPAAFANPPQSQRYATWENTAPIRLAQGGEEDRITADPPTADGVTRTESELRFRNPDDLQRPSPGANSGPLLPQATFTTGDLGRPQVMRYTCCDDVEFRAQPNTTSQVIGTLPHSSAIWVFDIRGVNNPALLAACMAGSTCSDLWAEAFSPDLSSEGFVRLSALFVRPIRGQVGDVTFEASYGRIGGAVSGAIRDNLVSPNNCSDTGGTIERRAATYAHRDQFITLADVSARSCQFILDAPITYVWSSCESLDPESSLFRQCLFANRGECAADAPAGREPSADRGFCSALPMSGRGTCGVCRDWYEATQQDRTGWQTQIQLVEACLRQVEADESGACLPPSNTRPGGSGPGTSRPGDGEGVFDTDNPGGGEPGDRPMPEPGPFESRVPASGPGSLDNQNAPQQDNPCAATCQESTGSFLAESCLNYLGPQDEKSFPDHKDYECGELPFGETHYGYRLNTAQGGFSGEEDEEWKRLAVVDFPNPHLNVIQPQGAHTFTRKVTKPLTIRMGRLGLQKPSSFNTYNLTVRESQRVDVPDELTVRNVWLAFSPERDGIPAGQSQRQADVLNVNACIYLPGTKIDMGEINYDQDQDAIWALIRKIDLGVLDVRETELCFSARAYFDENTSLRVDELDVTRTEIDAVFAEAFDIDWGGAAIAGTMVPIVDGLIAGTFMHTAVTQEFFNSTDTSLEQRFVDLFRNKFASDVFDDIVPTVEAALRTGIANGRLNGRERLTEACAALIPNVAEDDSLHYFYRYLRWNCDGFAGSHTLRALIPDQASEEQGCYGANAFFAPADAAGAPWWARYAGQQWFIPLWPNQGCRLGAMMASRLDAAIWPTLRCAAAVSNTWVNRGPQPPGSTFREMMTANCSQAGLDALSTLYGDGADLVALYREVHDPGPDER